MVPRVCQFTEILQDQAKHAKSLQMVNLQTFLGDFVTFVNFESYPSQAAAIYKHFTNILKLTELKTKQNVCKINLQTFGLLSRISTKSVNLGSTDIS